MASAGWRNQGMSRFLERLGRPVQRRQLIAEAAVLDTVVEVQLAGGKAFAELPIDPELIAIPAETGRLASFVDIEKVRSQPFGYGVCRNFGKRTLRETLLAVEDIFHPGQSGLPWTAPGPAEKSSVIASGRRFLLNRAGRAIDGPPAQFHLAVRSFAQTIAGGEKVIFRQDRERPFPDFAERRRVIDRLVDIEQQHAADPGRLPPPVVQGLGVRRLGRFLGLLLDLRHAVTKGVDEIIVDLPIALPGIAQQIQMSLPCRHPTQIEYRIVMHKTCIICCVLLGDAEPWKNGLGGRMQGRQRGMLLSLGDHHLIAKMFGVLLERRQFRQSAFAHEEILQRRACASASKPSSMRCARRRRSATSTSLMMVCSVV